jgi:hypothetical protein
VGAPVHERWPLRPAILPCRRRCAPPSFRFCISNADLVHVMAMRVVGLGFHICRSHDRGRSGCGPAAVQRRSALLGQAAAVASAVGGPGVGARQKNVRHQVSGYRLPHDGVSVGAVIRARRPGEVTASRGNAISPQRLVVVLPLVGTAACPR